MRWRKVEEKLGHRDVDIAELKKKIAACPFADVVQWTVRKLYCRAIKWLYEYHVRLIIRVPVWCIWCAAGPSAQCGEQNCCGPLF